MFSPEWLVGIGVAVGAIVIIMLMRLLRRRRIRRDSRELIKRIPDLLQSACKLTEDQEVLPRRHGEIGNLRRRFLDAKGRAENKPHSEAANFYLHSVAEEARILLTQMLLDPATLVAAREEVPGLVAYYDDRLSEAKLRIPDADPVHRATAQRELNYAKENLDVVKLRVREGPSLTSGDWLEIRLTLNAVAEHLHHLDIALQPAVVVVM